ncbi:hypothetical protein Pla175_03480 [Pirellulimonas nuda]|uniref:Putative restriction endonuclease domain-containing protein n=1 Tax=Pirellulimonas nuda TaxID=2528009 RepID=A0A518D694_9BACT|nr:Uma2 family endonuclease [Pirellulimonas nuda]QDU86994.1 hypothetical protein Pla175_03480 [Pirellulimonas nuda]
MPSLPPALANGPQYAWELATLYPQQGAWDEVEYLHLTDGSNRRIELTGGVLEFLPLPTLKHQTLAGFFYHALLAFVTKHDLGVVPFPPIRVRSPAGQIREPDALFLSKANSRWLHNRVFEGADLVAEVVSGDAKDRKRDLVTKHAEYAQAGISEYWVIDPEQRVVLVYKLTGAEYALHGRFESGEADSVLLTGFALDVEALFAAADSVPE